MSGGLQQAAAELEQPQLHHLQANGIDLAFFEWRPERRGQGRSLLLVHATGFHGRVWDSLVRLLPGQHVIALELRGHGRSQAAPFESWEAFSRDVADAAIALDLRDALAVGHSMGAAALVQAAAFCAGPGHHPGVPGPTTPAPARFSQLLLVDPVLLHPAAYHLHPVPPLVLHPAASRKNRFESPQAMFDRFASRPPYAVFQPAALMDYCQHGLHPADDGQGYELACAPAFEGKVYPLARQNPGVVAAVRALDIPVTVVRARPQDPSILPWDPLGSPTWPGLAAEFRHGTDVFLADKTHFLPMEDPALLAGLIRLRL